MSLKQRGKPASVAAERGEQMTEAVRDFRCLFCGFACGPKVSICWAHR